MSLNDLTLLNDALDPLLLALYALAWLGAFGAVPAVWAAAAFWRNGAGSRWSRIHHTLFAASSVMLAWFFVTFRIAGTTLNYREAHPPYDGSAGCGPSGTMPFGFSALIE
jgi:hypothetical protein